MEQSIIIIGAGLAGLSTGCYGQMNGYRTQIFEMHKAPGGLCTSWKRKGYTFDGCIHWLAGSRYGVFYRFYEELGAVQDRRMVDHEEWLRVEGPEGKTWIVYADLDQLEQHMVELSPVDAGVIKEFCNAARLLTRFEMPVEKPTELMGPLDMLKMLKMMPLIRAMGKYNKISTQKYASRFSDPFLREVFPFVLDELPGFAVMGVQSCLAGLHMRNAGWPIGGSLEFARAIERRYLGLGGEVQYGAWACAWQTARSTVPTWSSLPPTVARPSLTCWRPSTSTTRSAPTMTSGPSSSRSFRSQWEWRETSRGNPIQS
jgi:phytoene dehydrogenase-like protein